LSGAAPRPKLKWVGSPFGAEAALAGAERHDPTMLPTGSAINAARAKRRRKDKIRTIYSPIERWLDSRFVGRRGEEVAYQSTARHATPPQSPIVGMLFGALIGRLGHATEVGILRAMRENVHIHPTADVSPDAEIGACTRIWSGVQVRGGARIGAECILGKGVYIDFDVLVGSRCKIQNNTSVFHGAILEDGVFLGPHTCITNDLYPRAVTPSGKLKDYDDWEVGRSLLRYGCAVGAGSIIVTGVTIGRFALVGAGAVVTRSVPAHGLVVGNPARLLGYVCACGGRLSFAESSLPVVGQVGLCARCQCETVLPAE
jgi:UDP-2-acetamido-3-amino-2,3-dideoxy-glucuronate N-acetyltransferase